jgi:hypothetical protein
MKNAFSCVRGALYCNKNDNMYAFAHTSRPRESTISKLGPERDALSHLIIKWLWVILREVFKRSGLCAARQTRLLTTESCCCVRVSLTFVWGAALATAKNKYNDATLMSGTEIGATGNEKGKLSFYLCLVCLGSLLLCE